MLILGAIAGVRVPSLLLILAPLFPGGIGLFGDLTVLSSIVLGNFLVRRAIVFLPHGAPADRDGR
jgi:hypothetical protein